MNISFAEAFSLLEAWRNASIPLQVHFSGKEFQATIGAITGTVVSLITGLENMQIDIQGAEFNGDARPKSSNQSAYLVCEFRNGDRCSFYARRMND
jgi:hypothetical protein